MEVGLAGTDVPEGEAAGAAGGQPVEDAVGGEAALSREAETERPAAAVEEPAVGGEVAEPPAEIEEEPAGAVEVAPAEVAEEPAGAAEVAPAEVDEEPAAAVEITPAEVAEEPAGAAEAAPAEVAEEPAGAGGVAPAEVAEEPAAAVEMAPAAADEGSAAEGSLAQVDEGFAAGAEEVPAGTGSSPVGPVRASSMDSTTLPDRSRHDAESRRQRHRRSAARLPAVITPVDIPEDAEGRIDIVVIRAAPDRDEPGFGEPGASAPGGDWVRDLLTMGSGWVAVGGLAALLIVVFVVLELIYR